MSTKPTDHTTEARRRIDELVEVLRDGARRDRDPRAQALYETSAEVLLGVRTALDHYENKDEPAWRDR